MNLKESNWTTVVLLLLFGVLPMLASAQIKATEGTKLQANPHKSVPAGPYSQVMTNFGILVTQLPLANLGGKGKTSIQFGLSHRSQNSPPAGIFWPDKHFGQGFGNTAVDYLQMQDWLMTRYVGGYGTDSWAAAPTSFSGVFSLTRKPGVRDDLLNPIANRYVLTDFETKTVYTYDYEVLNAEGRRFYLTKVKDVFGNEVIYSYIGGKLDRITDSSGRFLKFFYVAGSERVSQVDLVTVDSTLSWNFSYIASGGNNHLDTIILPPTVAGGGRPTIEFDQDGQGNITYLRDPKGQLWRYDYTLQTIESFSSNSGGYIHQIQALTRAYAPDQTNPLFVNTAKYTQFSFFHDSWAGERTCTITRPQVTIVGGVALSPIEKHIYYAGPNTSSSDFPLPIKRVEDPTTNRFLNPRSVPTSVLWNWWETYESWDILQGNLLKYSDREAKVTEMTYDAGNRGLVTSIKKKTSAGLTLTTETMIYTSDGLLDTATDAFGTITKNTYDPTTRALTKQQIDPSGRNITKNYAYTSFGSLLSESTGTDAVTSYSNFDLYGNARTVRPANGSLATETYFTFDSKGNKLTVDPPAPQGVTTTTYDLWNRPVKVTLPDGKFTQTDYDNIGNVLSVKAEDGSTTLIEYDPIGGLRKTIQPVDSNPLNNLVTQYTYNALGWKLTTTNPEGKTTSFSYNQRGDLVKLDYPDGYNRQWGYDGVGNVVWRRNGRGQITYYGYDDLHRLVLTDYQTTTMTDVTYGYRFDGLRSSRTDQFGTATWTYNTAKQLQSSFDPATNKTTTYGYEIVNGRPTTVAAGANTWTTGYDIMYRPYRTTQSLTGATPVSELEFHDDQSLYRQKFSNNNTAQYSYDTRGRVTNIKHFITSNSVTLIDLSYTYTDGNISQYSHWVNNGPVHTTTYTHDLADRIKSEVRTGNLPVFDFNNVYNYDKAGNRTSVVRNGVSSSYSTGTNDKFLSGDGYAFGNYDPDGNPEIVTTPTAGTWTLSYDEESRLTTVARPAGLCQFKYNGDGQRVERVVSSGTTRYLFNGDAVMLTTNAGGTVQQYFTPGVGAYQNGKMLFNQENALGSTIRTCDPTDHGGFFEYDAFGIETQLNVTQQTDLRFAGKHGYISDPDTGFDLLGARYYIPKLGRFLTQDPIGHAGGLNLYAYCENSPLSKVDPDGKQGRGVGQPGFAESLIPVWGSGRAMVDDFQNGNYAMGMFNMAMMVSDCFMVGTVVKGVAKFGFKASMNVGNMSWKAVRSRINHVGMSDFSGQHFHHLIKQKYYLNSPALKFLLNQPFMVTKLARGGYTYKGVDYTMNGFHMLLDGRTVHGQSMSRLERIWYGSNNFHKAAAASSVGGVIRAGRSL